MWNICHQHCPRLLLKLDLMGGYDGDDNDMVVNIKFDGTIKDGGGKVDFDNDIDAPFEDF